MTKNTIKCTFCGKNRNESVKVVVSGAFSICDNCVFLFSKLLQNANTPLPKTQEKPQLAEQLDSIKIREFIDQYVVGQDHAKMSLCVSVVNHYKRMLYAQDSDELYKSNLMITGPSGSGKSLLIASIAKFLDVPFVCVDSTTLTEAGYIGQNVDTIISRLVIEANGDVAAAENGIVFLDEIDKIATGKSRSSTSDNRVSGIQSALLKMVEGTRVPLGMGLESKRSSKFMEVNTGNILFICGGAFIGLNDIVSARIKKKKGIGFTDTIANIANNIEMEYTTEDFIEYGLIPEFIGRFPMKTFTKELTEKELTSVLTNSKCNILSDYKFYFNVDEISLDFTQDFLERVASQAKAEKTGVRGLKSICDAIMMPHQYLIPEYKKRNVAKITFSGECVDKKQIPKIEIYEKKRTKKLI